jgi:TonB family protein
MGSGHSGRSRYSGYSAGAGNLGNPSPGNPNGSPGIDAVREPDWGPYMRELQRRIKRNWEPPRGDTSKRVVVMFKIARDGRLLARSIHTSSGVHEADEAALNAVELTAPFSPLPPEYRGRDIDIQFTFDYNVFSVGGRRY